MPNSFPIKTPETLLGFASRYAASRGMRLPQFMKLTGIKIWHFASFELAVGRLAKMTDNDPETLARHALRLDDGYRHRLRGEVIDHYDVERNAARYCPHCVMEDYSVGGSRPIAHVHCRASWMHGRLSICPDHGVPIALISKAYPGYAREDFATALKDNWKEVQNAADMAVSVKVSACERYFSNRLNGLPVANEVLDDLPYYAAFHVSEIIGAMASGRDDRAMSKYSAEDRREMAEAGFALLEPGYDGLRSFLSSRDELFTGNDDKTIGRQLYGRLYTYLHEHADEAEFLATNGIIRDHAFNVHPLGPENGFLGSGGVRKYHSVRSAFTEYGIHPATLRKLLAAADILEPDTPVRDLKVSVHVDVMATIIEGWKDSVPMSYVTERLATAPQVVRQLVDAGLLDAASEKADHNLNRYFSRKQIGDLMARLEALSCEDGLGSQMTSLKNCVPFMPFVAILRGILEKKIPAGTVKPADQVMNFEHLRVDLGAVKKLAGVGSPAGFVGANFMTTRVVALTDTIQRLTREGVFETTEYRSGNGLVVVGYSEVSVRAFLKEHISFRKLARGKENYAKTEVRVSRAKPVYDFGGVERIYRKADVYGT